MKHALRQLAKSPGFTAAVVLTLALGLGANAAIFSLVRSIVLRDLPYVRPEALVTLSAADASDSGLPPVISGAEYRQLAASTKTLGAVAAYSPLWNITVRQGTRSEGDFALYVSGNFFPTLGVSARLGRTLAATDDRAEAAPVIVVSDRFWRRHLDASPAAIGSQVTISATPMTVVGIMPPDFEFQEAAECWIPMAHNSFNNLARVRLFQVIGRLANGVSPAQADAEVGPLLLEIARTANNPFGPRLPRVTSLHEQVTHRVRPALFAMQAAGGLLLGAMGANLLLLLFARYSARTREFGVRLALGAGPWQVARLIIGETSVLALLGGGLGVLFAWWTLDGLLALAPARLLPRRPEIALDGAIVLGAALFALGGAALAGGLIAWRQRRIDLNTVLKAGGRSPAVALGRGRSVLVVAEIAVAIVLLGGIALLSRSLVRLLQVPPGFNAQNVVALPLLTSGPQYSTRAQRLTLYHELERRLGALPGVESIGAVNRLPFLGGGPENAGANSTSRFFAEGRDYATRPEGDEPDYRVASPSYFTAMQIPLLAGRTFTWGEAADGAGVAVINEALARRFWPGQYAVGKRFRAASGTADTPWIEVIGVVANVRHFSLELEPRPEVYRPYTVNPMGSPILALRLNAPAPAVVPAVRAALRELDPTLVPASQIIEMEQLIARSHAQRRFLLTIFAAFGGITLLLAIVGIYGVVSQYVIDRRYEFATRAALGASPADLMRLVFGRWVALALPGVAIGIAVSFLAARLLRGLLFSTAPYDPLALLLPAAVISAVALSACWLPARRAARTDPMTALRSE